MATKYDLIEANAFFRCCGCFSRLNDRPINSQAHWHISSHSACASVRVQVEVIWCAMKWCRDGRQQSTAHQPPRNVCVLCDAFYVNYIDTHTHKHVHTNVRAILELERLYVQRKEHIQTHPQVERAPPSQSPFHPSTALHGVTINSTATGWVL